MGDRTERLSPAAKWLLMILVTVLLIGATVLAAEGAVRLRQTLKYGTAKTVDDFYTVDAIAGLRVPIAGMTSGRITVNRLGFRGPEITVPKPPGVVRIAFLGSSTTWCGEVSSNEKVWPHMVTSALQEVFPGARFDYVNGGVPGYTLAASLKNLEYRVGPLEPDVIVIYEATNDLSGEMRELAHAAHLIPHTKFVERSWLETHSLLLHLVVKNLAILRAQQAARENHGRLKIDPSQIGAEFRKELTALVEAARRRAKVVAVVTSSTQLRRGQSGEDQLQAAVSALFYMPFMSPSGLIEAYARYNEIIREVATHTGVLLIDGEDTIPGDSVHFNDTVHFTDAGSERMATRVTKALAEAPVFRRLVEHGS